jgi:hypothetical protein
MVFMLIGSVLIGFQNCGGFNDVVFTVDSKNSHQINLSSLSQISYSGPRIVGFDPGPKPGELYKCNLEAPISDLIYKGVIHNRIQINPFPSQSLGNFSFELIGVYGNYLQTDIIRPDSSGSFSFELPAFDSQVHYFVRIRDQNLITVCTTPAALIRKRGASCSLNIAQTEIMPGQSTSFSVKNNVGHLQQSLTASWVTTHNGQIIENGSQNTMLSNLDYRFYPGNRTGNFTRALIIRDINNNAEVCRTNTVAFKVLTSEEANRNLSDISTPNRDSSGSIGIPVRGVGGSSGSSRGSGGDFNDNPEDREWCRAAQLTIQCYVIRTYCAGKAPYQSTVTDEYPVIERHTVTLPRRPIATMLENYLEFSDKRYVVTRLRSRYFCDPSKNPQWQYQEYFGFSCNLSVDNRPPGGCDSSGYNQN